MYRDSETGKTMAKSKWFYANGEYELRDCEVLSYLEAEEQYEVKWAVNDGTKRVSRFNLIFDKEDEVEFQKRIEEAKSHRDYAEKIMRYNYMIDNTKTPHFELSDEQKTSISYMISSFKSQTNVEGKKFRNPMEFLHREAKDRYVIPETLIGKKGLPSTVVEEIHKDIIVKNYSLESLSHLFKDLDKDYMRSHKQIHFDMQLPYSTEKYSMFRTILPKEKFVPVSERIICES